jgi:hypothetical protein
MNISQLLKITIEGGDSAFKSSLPTRKLPFNSYAYGPLRLPHLTTLKELA